MNALKQLGRTLIQCPAEESLQEYKQFTWGSSHNGLLAYFSSHFSAISWHLIGLPLDFWSESLLCLRLSSFDLKIIEPNMWNCSIKNQPVTHNQISEKIFVYSLLSYLTVVTEMIKCLVSIINIIYLFYKKSLTFFRGEI